MPHIVTIAGPNGAGKTTSAQALLSQTLNIHHFVNADTIAAGLSAFAPEKAAMQAGRAMLERIRFLANTNEDFAFETTLASKTFAPWIAELKERGYSFHLTFLYLESPELAVSRVSERVKLGGHSVPQDTIRRRYVGGLKNFFKLYRPITDSWQMYDNTIAGDITSIASEFNGELTVLNEPLWQKLVEVYGNE